GCRAVARVMSLLAWALGIPNAPGPQTVITWGLRLTIVRIAAARRRKGWPLRQAPFTHGLLCVLDIRIGLSTGKMVAVLAFDATRHALGPRALSLDGAGWLGVSVADAWTGDTLAELLGRLIAPVGRPAAYLKDGASDRHKAISLLEEQGLASPSIDALSH